MSLRKPKRLQQGTVAHKRSPKQESEIAKRYGGELVRGSGCGAVKGDVRIEGVARIEAKTTARKSYRLTLEDLAKIEQAALSSDEVPIMEVEFIDKKGKPINSIAIIPTWLLEEFLSDRINGIPKS